MMRSGLVKAACWLQDGLDECAVCFMALLVTIRRCQVFAPAPFENRQRQLQWKNREKVDKFVNKVSMKSHLRFRNLSKALVTWSSVYRFFHFM